MTSETLERPEVVPEAPKSDDSGDAVLMSPSNATAAAGVAVGAVLTLLIPFPGVSVLGAAIGGLIGKKMGQAMSAVPKAGDPGDDRR